MTRDDGMTACTCTTCGLVHEVPPLVDWTHYERDVLALVDMWLTSQEAALAAVRAGRIPAPDLALEAAQGLIRTYFPGTAYAFLMPMLSQGRIDVSRSGTYTTVWRAEEGVVWPVHAARPGGAS